MRLKFMPATFFYMRHNMRIFYKPYATAYARQDMMKGVASNQQSLRHRFYPRAVQSYKAMKKREGGRQALRPALPPSSLMQGGY
jgi:hypothetical protein